MPTKLSEKKQQEHEERALRTARSIAEVDRVMHQEDLASRDLYITNVAPDPQQPRRFYPEDEHELQELAESIRRNGLLQPISVRPNPAEPNRFLIIVGERRWRASQLAGKTRIRAVVHHMDEYAVRAAQYAENNKRADVSDVSRARSLQAMYEEERKQDGGWAEVAVASGITRMHVNRLTSLLRLPEAVTEMIDRKLLASAHGYELVRVVSHLPDEEIVRLAQACRKPKRGEAFASSVENLREQVNEILTHVQRSTRARSANAEPAAGRNNDPAPAPEVWKQSHSPATEEIVQTDVAVAGISFPATEQSAPGFQTANSVSLFESAIKSTVDSGQERSSQPAHESNLETIRPHVQQILTEIAGSLLRDEELKRLKEALA